MSLAGRCDVAPPTRQGTAAHSRDHLSRHLGRGEDVLQCAHITTFRRDMIMVLLTTFIVTLIIGDLAVIAIAWVVEQFSKTAGLLVFLTLFLGFIPVAWRIAVRLTEPKGAAAGQP
jgi:hypothetical protein